MFSSCLLRCFALCRVFLHKSVDVPWLHLDREERMAPPLLLPPPPLTSPLFHLSLPHPSLLLYSTSPFPTLISPLFHRSLPHPHFSFIPPLPSPPSLLLYSTSPFPTLTSPLFHLSLPHPHFSFIPPDCTAARTVEHVLHMTFDERMTLPDIKGLFSPYGE